METLLTGWADIPELRFDAAAQALTIVYHSGVTRRLSPVNRAGIDRFLGRSSDNDGAISAASR